MTFSCISFAPSKVKFQTISFSRLFRRLDKDNSWTLSKDEMSRGVAQFGLEFSTEEIDQLFKDFEKDGAAGINYEEFLEALRVSVGGGVNGEEIEL